MNAIAKHEEAHPVTLPADPMVSMIERLVLNPDADLDKLERMLALKRDHDRDNARISFAAALASARAKIPPIVKDATVDFTSNKGRTHYKHETLAGIAKVIDPILSEFGLSYRFRTAQDNGGVRVTCIIAHAHGHSEETSLSCAPDGSGSKNPFQAVGSAVTYLQRYTLKAALGLSAEIDDDGQAAAPRIDGAKMDSRADYAAMAARIEATFAKQPTVDDLTDAWQRSSDDRREIHDAGRDDLTASIKAAFSGRKKALETKPIDPSEIPY